MARHQSEPMPSATLDPLHDQVGRRNRAGSKHSATGVVRGGASPIWSAAGLGAGRAVRGQAQSVPGGRRPLAVLMRSAAPPGCDRPNLGRLAGGPR